MFGQENDVIKDASKNQDWGDFGGSAKPGESETETCVREGAEELNGFFGNKRDFRALLRKNLLLKLTYDTRVTQLMRVDYDERLPLYKKWADCTLDCRKLTHEQAVAKIITLLRLF